MADRDLNDLQTLDSTNIAMERPLIVEEAGLFLNISRGRMYEYISQRLIPCHKVFGRTLFFRSELVEWIKAMGEEKKVTVQQALENL